MTEAQADPWGLCVTPERFEQQMAVLSRHAEPMPLADLVAAASTDGPARGVAVTFDDGYVDNLWAAAPVLERWTIPATVFVATGYVDTDRAFWWDVVQDVLLTRDTLPPSLSLDIAGITHTWTIAPSERFDRAQAESVRTWRAWDPPPTSRHAVYLDVWNRLRPLAEGTRHEALTQLTAWADTCGAGRNDAHAAKSPSGAMTAAQLREIASSGLVTLGAHTVTHPLLSSLPIAEQAREIAGSRATVEQVAGRPVTAFAYPYGDQNDDTRAAVRAAGLALACAGGPGVVTAASDPLCLPRVGVEDWNAGEFGRRLDGWMRS
ncbi:MAG TPA: polysaccharide deacetylase family protein [Thermoleophilia bacterium]|nr:polysaccharide deacetylase family protein [Thermoleophilia bacterium]